MKIADAYFDGGFGQRRVQPAGVVMPDTSGAEAIAGAGMKLGGAIANIGLQQLEEESQVALSQAHERKLEAGRVLREQEAEMKKTLELKEGNAAKRQYLSFESELARYEQTVINDPEVPPEEYPRAISKKAQELATKLKGGLNERQWLAIEVDTDRYGRSATERAFLAAQKEVKDQAWAEDLAAADAVVDNPLKPARDKIRILNDPNFMADTGRSPREIDSERENRISRVIDNEVKHQFNAIGDDLEALKELKATLQRTDASGLFAYFPEMDQAKREEYVSSVQMKMGQAESRRREESNRRRTEERQAASELVTEFKDKVARGWIPNSADDYQFVNAAKRASKLSPSLSRQFGEASSNMGSMAFRNEIRKKDPLGVAAAERGVILPPINFLDQNTLPQQAANRLAIAKQLGVKAIFTGPEVDGLADYLKTLDPRAQVAYVSAFGKAFGPFGPATFNAAAEQTRVKDPSVSMLFKLVANGKVNEAQLYASGKALVTGEKKDFLQDRVAKLSSTMSTEFDTAMGTALAGMRDSRNALKDTVAMAYIGAASQRNLPLDTLDKNLFREVVTRIVGKTTTTGNKYIGAGGSMKTTVIPQGMDEDSFLDAIKAIKPADIARLGGVKDMSDEAAAQYLKKVAWHELGNGYTFMREGRPLYTKKGRPFIFRFD